MVKLTFQGKARESGTMSDSRWRLLRRYDTETLSLTKQRKAKE
jgi:hypothetical protein